MSNFAGLAGAATEEARIKSLAPYDHKKTNQMEIDIDGFLTPISVGWLENPPKIPEDIEMFDDGIKELVPEKLKLLIDRQDELVQIRDKRLKLVDGKTSGDRLKEYLEVYDIEAQFAEYYIIQKWMRYWMKILKRVDSTFVDVVQDDGISEEDIARAKEVPIEDLYDGRLRGVSRLVGVCPFHEERSASFTIFTNDNSFYCFGCHAHGDVIDYFMATNKVNFVEAVKQLNG